MRFIFIPIFFLSISLQAQNDKSYLIIEGKNPTVLLLNDYSDSEGKLSSGEVVKVVCFGGSCSMNIQYKGRSVSAQIADAFETIRISEFEFGDFGETQLIVEVNYNGSNYLTIFRYGAGMIQKLFELEIGYYKTIVKKNYIEYYMPSYLESVWHFYNGFFFELCSMN